MSTQSMLPPRNKQTEPRILGAKMQSSAFPMPKVKKAIRLKRAQSLEPDSEKAILRRDIDQL